MSKWASVFCSFSSLSFWRWLTRSRPRAVFQITPATMPNVHKIVDMAIRSLSCSCGRVFRLTSAECAGGSTRWMADELLDRHAAHKADKKEGK